MCSVLLRYHTCVPKDISTRQRQGNCSYKDQLDADLDAAEANAILAKERAGLRTGWEDIPFRPHDDSKVMRFDPAQSGRWNTVRCWPSVGGMVRMSHGQFSVASDVPIAFITYTPYIIRRRERVLI